MSLTPNAEKPLSLTQHFEAPSDFIGVFGWVCGYSADADFMNQAVERFTRQTRGQRAFGGKAALALLLDPGNQQLTFCDVPGVVHLAIRNPANKPFVLLHAKVAMLGFRHPTDISQWMLRLVVSTGNWTCQTLEESLDLAWKVDVSSQDLDDLDGSTVQACADFKAAAKMFNWLKAHFDTSLLAAAHHGFATGPATSAEGLFDSWLAKVVSQGGQGKPRFFTNLNSPLLGQLPTLVNDAEGVIKRNYLAMGSGFFEAANGTNAAPVVPLEIVASLREQGLLTMSAELDLFVNQHACQAVATCLTGLGDAGFAVRAAHAPEKLFGKDCKRFLHAKFIFSANSRSGSNYCNSAWLYLGSGNLTGPGFTSKVSRKGGNLEAGVVFSVPGLHWVAEDGHNTAALVTDFLPLQWKTKISEADELKAGQEMEVRELQYAAAPVAWLTWCEDISSRWLQVPEGATEPFSVLDDSGVAQQPDERQRVLWSAQRPREVTLAWHHENQNRHATVPVLDEYGRIAGAALPKLELDQVWWELANFPLPPQDDDLETQENESSAGPAPPPKGQMQHIPEASYPIREVMELIENIADKQTQLLKTDWTAWCVRLQQCLLQATQSPGLAAFKQLGLNPLSPLWHNPFRPDFAEAGDSPEGLRYEAVLQHVEQAWGVTAMKKLGAINE